MPKWFVYTNTTYYPWAEVIEAESPEAAMVVMLGEYGDCDEGLAVFPLDALALWAGTSESIESGLPHD